MAEPPVPDGYAAFVAAHADRIRASATALTGNERLVDRLQNDVFAATAARWRWLHRRWPRRAKPDAAQDYLWGLLRREAAGWSGLELRPMMFEPAPIATATAADPAYRRRAALLAANTWAQAGRQRRQRLLIAAAVVIVLGCGAVLMPGRATGPAPGPRPPTTTGPGLVSAAPPNLAILPRVAVLADAAARTTPLPRRVNASTAGIRSLAGNPLPRAAMLVQLGDGALLIVGGNGQSRLLDPGLLSGGNAVDTSLSPDGTLAAVPLLDGILLIDIGHGTTHKITSAVPRPAAFRPTLVWRTSRALVVAEAGDTSQVDVATGKATPLTGVTGVHTVVQQGPTARLTDLLPVGVESGEPAVLRTWEGLAATAAPIGDASDRAVTGAPWLGGWVGGGWANESLVVRGCSAVNLRLPPTAGMASSAVVAIDLRDGRMIAALAVVEPGVTSAVLGWLDQKTALVELSMGDRTVLIGWNVVDRSYASLAEVDAAVTLSLPDLLAWR
jgi:hypothetical protein